MASKFQITSFCHRTRKIGIFCLNYTRNSRFLCTTVRNTCNSVATNNNRICYLTNGCDIHELESVQELFHDNLLVYDEFITPQEEVMLHEELRTSLEKQTYQHEHWDDAIHGYRESEKETWSKDCMMIFKRMKDLAFNPEHNLLPYVHVLDLDSKGFIKPHIDSVKRTEVRGLLDLSSELDFCGSTIAGLSLLSPAIMRFRHDNFKSVTIDAMLNPRSLYICRNAVRYQFSHELLPPELSIWKENIIERTRRISLMLRCEPEPNQT